MSKPIPALACLIFAAAACGPQPGPGEDPSMLPEEGQQQSGEFAEDLEGDPCSFEDKWHICGPEQVQFCGYSEWGECRASDDCIAGDTLPFEGDLAEYCDVAARCVDFGEGTAWEHFGCNTPLVLNFSSEPIEFTPATTNPEAAEFAVGAEPRCTHDDWPTAATPWLVRDVDADGRISGSAELFGSGTALATGTKAKHGFDALRDLDDDHNGVIDERDRGFTTLAVWADHDGDRRSSPSELSTLASLGVDALPLEWETRRECDARGNCASQRATFDFNPGAGRVTQGELVDVYLRCQ